MNAIDRLSLAVMFAKVHRLEKDIPEALEIMDNGESRKKRKAAEKVWGRLTKEQFDLTESVPDNEIKSFFQTWRLRFCESPLWLSLPVEIRDQIYHNILQAVDCRWCQRERCTCHYKPMPTLERHHPRFLHSTAQLFSPEAVGSFVAEELAASYYRRMVFDCNSLSEIEALLETNLFGLNFTPASYIRKIRLHIFTKDGLSSTTTDPSGTSIPSIIDALFSVPSLNPARLAFELLLHIREPPEPKCPLIKNARQLLPLKEAGARVAMTGYIRPPYPITDLWSKEPAISYLCYMYNSRFGPEKFCDFSPFLSDLGTPWTWEEIRTSMQTGAATVWATPSLLFDVHGDVRSLQGKDPWSKYVNKASIGYSRRKIHLFKVVTT